MDADSETVLIISLLIVLLNLLFILSVFVYLCCCIEVLSVKSKPNKHASLEEMNCLNDINDVILKSAAFQ